MSKRFLWIVSLGLFMLMVGCSDVNYEPAVDSPNIAESVTPSMFSTYTSITMNDAAMTDPTQNGAIDYVPAGESYNEIVENIFIRTEDMAVSTFSVDVDTASYSNVRRYLNDGIIPNPNAVRIEELINYFKYDFEEPTDGEDINVITEVSTAPWNPDHQLMMVGIKTEDIDFDEAPANNLVFLLDVSGSMNYANKLPLLKNAMKLLVNEIRPIDKISIVVYAGAAGLVLDGADGTEYDTIIQAIDSLEAGGSTAGAAGINLAYQVAMEHYIEGGNNRVILATDGDFNVGVSTQEGLEDLIVEKRDSGVFLSVLGFGTGNVQDSKMETLADKGNGVFYYIDSLLEAKKVFVEELGGSLITVAKDVKLQVEFNPANVKAYRLIGYENRVLNYDDFDDDTKDAGDMGAGHEMIAFFEIIPVDSEETVESIEVDQPETKKYDGISMTDELATISIRYKDPDSDTSQLIDHITYVADITGTPSESFRFASSVVEFGLVLRQSQFKGGASFTAAIDRAAGALGDDELGYRAEFLELIQKAMQLTSDQE